MSCSTGDANQHLQDAARRLDDSAILRERDSALRRERDLRDRLFSSHIRNQEETVKLRAEVDGLRREAAEGNKVSYQQGRADQEREERELCNQIVKELNEARFEIERLNQQRSAEGRPMSNEDRAYWARIQNPVHPIPLRDSEKCDPARSVEPVPGHLMVEPKVSLRQFLADLPPGASVTFSKPS